MSAAVPLLTLTVDEYLESEKFRSVRHEYVSGQIYAMAGASDAHNRIALNIASRLLAGTRGGPCRVFMSDMKLRVEAANAFYYPDVFVTCDPKDTENYFKTRPCLIIEVTSPTTAVIDRREKLLAYKRIASLREYVLISQEEMSVEFYRLDRGGRWWVEPLGPEDNLKLESVDLEIAVKEIYEDVGL
ncbi:MAG TPA: Uma2 family endonuclease [Blastocatellia bacterium]